MKRTERKNAVEYAPTQFECAGQSYQYRIQAREILNRYDISVSYLSTVSGVSLPVVYNVLNGIRDTRLEIYLKLFIGLNSILKDEAKPQVTFEQFTGLKQA